MDGEAGHREEPTYLPLKLRRRPPHQAAKAGAERAQAFITHRQADFRNRQALTSQKAFGLIDAKSREEFERRFAERAREEPVVMVGREAGFPRRVCQAERLVQSRGQIVSRPAQAPEQLVVDQRSKPVRRCINKGMRQPFDSL